MNSGFKLPQEGGNKGFYIDLVGQTVQAFAASGMLLYEERT